MFDGSNWVCTSSVNGKWSDGATSGDIVYTGGNVGIGTDEPGAKLEIQGASENSIETIAKLTQPGVEVGKGAALGFLVNNFAGSIEGVNHAPSRSRMSITDSESNPVLTVITNDNGNGDGGNVGIGTTSPSATLDVRSGEKTGTNTLARFSTAEDANQQLLYIQNIENTGMLIQATESSVSNNNLLLNRHGGNVGIATLSPDARLDVEGSLQADTFTGEAKIYTHAQEITTNSAVDVEHFAMYIGQGVYSTIALVNQGDGTVDTYQFDYSGNGLTVGNFQPKQTLTGFTNPNDAEVFQEYEYDTEGNIVTATETYLIVGDASDAAILHQWDGTNFVAITGKEIPTTGHTDTEVFYIDGQQVIALAQSEEIDIRTWDGSEYSIKDPIKLDGVQKLHFFEADLNADDATEGYLAAATASGLTIYQWEEGQGYYVFSEFATLDAPNAQNAHFFGINKDSETGKYERQFLMVPSDGNVDSPLYEWNGTEFEVTQTLDTYSGSVAATNFEFEGTEYLVLTAKGNSDSNYDYIRFFYYEDDIFKIRQSLSSKNIATGVNGLMDIETWFFGGEHRLMLAEATPSRVLRIEEYNNVIIGIDNIGQSEEHNLYVPGGDILMSIYEPTNIDGISYNDGNALNSSGIFSFHADQEHRPGWDSPGAALSANSAFILSEASSNGFIAATPNSDNSSSLIFDEAGDFSLRSQSRDNLGTFIGDNIKFILQGDTGNVGIGTTDPGAKLEVQGDFRIHDGSGEVFRLVPEKSGTDDRILTFENTSRNGSAGWLFEAPLFEDGDTIGKNVMKINNNGNVTIAGTATANGVLLESDSRYKKDIQTLPSALQNILSLHGVSYYWKDRDDDTQQIGVIAQEVEKIYPQLVHTNEDGYKSVAYSNLVSPLIEAVKELHALYQGHADRLAALEAQNAEQDNHIAHQDERIAHQDELIVQLEEQNVGLLKTVVQLEVRLAALEAAQ